MTAVAATTGPDILSADFDADPYPFYAEMRDRYPLYHHEVSGFWMVSRDRDVERIFKDGESFSSRNYEWQNEPLHGGRTMLQLDGREHSAHRTIVGPQFRGAYLEERVRSIVEHTVHRLIDRFGADGEVDLRDRFTKPFPLDVIMYMIGLPLEDHETFRQWVDLGIEFQSNFAGDPEVERRGLEAQAQFAEYLTPIITARRADPGEDLLSKMLLGASDGISMEDWEVRAFTSLLVSAGGETTDKALASMVCRLLENPEQMEAVRQDRSLITAALAETLRHSGPVQMIMRQAEYDVELSGGVVPAGGTVACVLGAANRDPDQFDDPDTFDIARHDLDVAKAFNAAADHVEFALGRHFCVGAHLSRVEVEVAMDALLDRFPEMSFAPGFTADGHRRLHPRPPLGGSALPTRRLKTPATRRGWRRATVPCSERAGDERLGRRRR